MHFFINLITNAERKNFAFVENMLICLLGTQIWPLFHPYLTPSFPISAKINRGQRGRSLNMSAPEILALFWLVFMCGSSKSGYNFFAQLAYSTVKKSPSPGRDFMKKSRKYSIAKIFVPRKEPTGPVFSRTPPNSKVNQKSRYI